MSTKRFLIVAGVLAAAMLTVAVAQKSAMQHHGGMGEMGFGDHSAHLAKYLNLTDQQKTSVQNIFAAEKPKMQPLMQDLGSAHKEIQAAIDDGTLDQSKALTIIEAHKSQLAQLLAEHAQVHSQIMQVLTPEQQAKFKTMHAGHGGHMHPGMGMGENESPSPDQSSH